MTMRQSIVLSLETRFKVDSEYHLTENYLDTLVLNSYQLVIFMAHCH